MMCFLWQHVFFLWYLPGTACLYSGPSPVDLARLRHHLLHACWYWYCGCHSQDTAVGRDRTHYSFSSVRAVVYGFSSKLVYDVLLLCLLRVHRYSYDTYLVHTRRTLYESKQDAVWSLVHTTFSYWGACWSKVLVLVWYHMYVRVVTVDFSFKCVFHFFSRYVGTW